MNWGFNSDVRVGDTLYHVQTEDRGTAHPFVDTIIYTQGRVVHRRTFSYQDLLGSSELSAAALRQRVEEQHRGVVEELRAGTLKLDLRAAVPAPGGIRVRLLNPASWLAAGMATLQIEVRARPSGQPAPDVNVEVTLEGPRGPARFAARTNPEGCTELSFPVPELGLGGATLVIRAAGASGRDEIRFQLRPKPGAPAPQAPAK